LLQIVDELRVVVDQEVDEHLLLVALINILFLNLFTKLINRQNEQVKEIVNRVEKLTFELKGDFSDVTDESLLYLLSQRLNLSRLLFIRLPQKVPEFDPHVSQNYKFNWFQLGN